MSLPILLYLSFQFFFAGIMFVIGINELYEGDGKNAVKSFIIFLLFFIPGILNVWRLA